MKISYTYQIAKPESGPGKVRVRILNHDGNCGYLNPKPAIGTVLEGYLEAEKDWLVGCPIVRLENGYHLAVGWECEVLERIPPSAPPKPPA
jgi:hypothetical protein